jgi:hypothetical protein
MEPEKLERWFVVEVGVRQAWPFLTFCDPDGAGDTEVRLYIDTEFRLEPGGRHFSDGDSERATVALLDLNNGTVTGVERHDDCGLVVRFDGNDPTLSVSGTGAAFTTQDVWWLAGPWREQGP